MAIAVAKFKLIASVRDRALRSSRGSKKVAKQLQNSCMQYRCTSARPGVTAIVLYSLAGYILRVRSRVTLLRSLVGAFVSVSTQTVIASVRLVAALMFKAALWCKLLVQLHGSGALRKLLLTRPSNIGQQAGLDLRRFAAPAVVGGVSCFGKLCGINRYLKEHSFYLAGPLCLSRL